MHVKMRLIAWTIAFFCSIQSMLTCSAWITSDNMPRRQRFVVSTTRRYADQKNSDNNKNDDGEPSKEENEEDFKRRMAVVRSLQMSYYKPTAIRPGTTTTTTTTSTTPSSEKSEILKDFPSQASLNEETGELYNLPLFRAPWWEVPGRSNVLNIHEAIYTNMFEKILYGPKPWCFGHLYLEDGSRNLKSDNPKFQLQSWDLPTKKTTQKHTESSAVIGCLMNISDYRRFADGRLLLLVHAMERFVVTKVEQTLPYSICQAQILPDAEEIDPALDFGFSITEEDLAIPRALAIQESVRYHDYEYDRDHVLPIPYKADMKVSDVLGSHIAKVLPYCPFSKTLNPPEPAYTPILPSSAAAPEEEEKTKIQDEDGEPLPSLEYRLLCQGVYQTPLVDPDFPERQHLTTDELEYELWLAVNNFLIQTRTPVSPVLLGLLPTHLDIWPTSTTTAAATPMAKNETVTSECEISSIHTKPPFALKQIVSDLASIGSVDHDFVQVSPEYPAHRRQRRLSYSAAHLLESNSDVANELRPKLLAIPTTKQRLRMVLEKFDQWQERKWGEFQ